MNKSGERKGTHELREEAVKLVLTKGVPLEVPRRSLVLPDTLANLVGIAKRGDGVEAL